MFRRLGSLCPNFRQFQELFPESMRRRESLIEFYAIMIAFCTEALRVIKGRSEFSSVSVSLFLANGRLLKPLKSSSDHRSSPLSRVSRILRLNSRNKIDSKIKLASELQAHRARQEMSLH